MQGFRARQGFTLIELLVVIAIIAILAAILFPVFAKAREKARQTTCLNNQRQIAAAILMFVQDHDETMPTAGTWVSDLAATYGVTGKVWDCPTTSFKGTESNPDYFYVGGSLLSGAALGDVTNPANAIMLGDLANAKTNKPYADDAMQGTPAYLDLTRLPARVDFRHGDGAVCAYVDGHTSYQSKSAVKAMSFIDSIPADLSVPVVIGTVMPTKLYVYSNYNYLALGTQFRTDLRTAGFPITYAAGTAGAGILRMDNGSTSTDTADTATARALLPAWLSTGKISGVFQTLPTAELESAGGNYLSGSWASYGILKTLNVEKTLTFTCAANCPVNYKRVGYGVSMGSGTQGTGCTLTLTKVTMIDGGVSTVYTITGEAAKAVAIKGDGTNYNYYQQANGLLIPVKPNRTIVLSFVMSLTGAPPAYGYGNNLLFEE
jgi:prepilin-type N-terminal cleavage/methylation domain-containing protein/prepilin-type processing-associated H-X9-DG protein